MLANCLLLDKLTIKDYQVSLDHAIKWQVPGRAFAACKTLWSSLCAVDIEAKGISSRLIARCLQQRSLTPIGVTIEYGNHSVIQNKLPKTSYHIILEWENRYKILIYALLLFVAPTFIFQDFPIKMNKV